VKGEDMTFYSPEEVIIAKNENKIDLHASIKVRTKDVDENGNVITKVLETTVGRVLFNELVPDVCGYINDILTKKALRDIISKVLAVCGTARAAQFLDDIKNLGFTMAFRGGLSFNLDDVIIPAEKDEMIGNANKEVEEVMMNYNMGLITNNERYNQIIDIWTHTNTRLTSKLMERLIKDQQGFNSIYMMMDSGARGSKEQIRQLSGMRGLMAKPQKSGASSQDIIENPILSNFKEGLSVLEYFISTHGARKGLADTALKTADAGYLTRRLVDVAQDVVINEDDCGTLRGVLVSALKKNDDIVESLYDRILGRVTVHDVYKPGTDELIIGAGLEVTEEAARMVEESDLESVEVRSVLTCEMKRGVCSKCYGRNLSSSQMAVMGDAVGVIAAQSIGEPGTQLTLRTFHVGGTAANIAEEADIKVKFEGNLDIEELKTIPTKDKDGKDVLVVIGRSAEAKVTDSRTGIILMTANIPYGSTLVATNNSKVKKGDVICKWDPYNAVILSDAKGVVMFENITEGETFREEIDEQTGFTEKVITENKNKKTIPTVSVVDAKTKETIRSYNLPVSAHIVVNHGDKIEAGTILVKIPRVSGKSGDITGGLPRVTELFEARNPSNPAVVAEIDGIVTYGKIKRGNREIVVESKTGEVRRYLVPLSKHILVQENDFVKAGQSLSDGAITPRDILNIKGPTAVQEYLVNEIQEVYRLQGVKINDKHFEVIVRQMMLKVEIEEAGDTKFLEGQSIHKADFFEENDSLYGKKVVIDPGESEGIKAGQIITARKLRDENSTLKRKDKKLIDARDAVPATSVPLLQGITKASLQTRSFISAASFQETTKVLNEAALNGKQDFLLGLKENVIVGHKIPAGTGFRSFQQMVVGNQEEYDELVSN
jgi:DNA-directed RNA polymerase subunit beta'